jgi:hypothetical protein
MTSKESTAIDESAATLQLAYDYTNQAWVQDGRYLGCGHSLPCDCYGRRHEGEAVTANAEVH